MAELRVTPTALPKVQQASTAVQLSEAAMMAPGKGMEAMGAAVQQTGQQTAKTGKFFAEYKKAKVESDDWKADADLRLKFSTYKQKLEDINASEKDKNKWLSNFDEIFKDFGSDEYNRMSDKSRLESKYDFDFKINEYKTEWINAFNVQNEKEKTDTFNTLLSESVKSGEWENIEPEVNKAVENDIIFANDAPSLISEKRSEAQYQNIVNITNADPLIAMDILQAEGDVRISHLDPKQIDTLFTNAKEKQSEYNTLNLQKIREVQLRKEATPQELKEAEETIRGIIDYHGKEIPDKVMSSVLKDMASSREPEVDNAAYERLLKKARKLDPNSPTFQQDQDEFNLDWAISQANLPSRASNHINETYEKSIEASESKKASSMKELRNVGFEAFNHAKLSGVFGNLYDYDPTEIKVGETEGWFGWDWTKMDITEDRPFELMQPDETKGFGKGFDMRSEVYQSATSTEIAFQSELEEWIESRFEKDDIPTRQEVSKKAHEMISRNNLDAMFKVFSGGDSDVNGNSVSYEELQSIIDKI